MFLLLVLCNCLSCCCYYAAAVTSTVAATAAAIVLPFASRPVIAAAFDSFTGYDTALPFSPVT